MTKSLTVSFFFCLPLALYEADRLAHEEAVMNGGVSPPPICQKKKIPF